MKVPAKKLTEKHSRLIQTDFAKVTSHVQRAQGDWIINTIQLEGYDVPFRYKRKSRYRDITGQRVNLTYYPVTEKVAGLDFEYMKVVRIKVS